MPDSTVPAVPATLKARGRKLWRDLHGVYEFDSHESVVVLEACRVLDTIDGLAESISADGVMITGSQGQSVLNGAVAELRQQQQSLTRLLTALNLDAATSAGAVALQTEISSKASKAANARWSRSKGIRRA